MTLAWYVNRLSLMSPPEFAMRCRDGAVKLLWRRRWVRDASADRSPLPRSPARFGSPLPPGCADAIAPDARARLLACADRLLLGKWKLFARERVDLGPDPDWFADPRTGRRAPADPYCFSIDHRAEHAVGNIKYVWELSRHHHLTVLAAAYHLTGEERYARRASEHLASWWRRNPFLSGIHWTSGIEVGVRLISWVWVRRLLDAWPPAVELFERNADCLRQLRHHQEYLATLYSHDSSANNHLIAEAAGLFAASCAFPWFAESDAWRTSAAATLRREIARQTFPCGLNRELATDYHAFVLELSLAAALEGEAAGCPLGDETWAWLRAMTDAAAAVVDVGLRPPRQGDGDDAVGLLLDDPATDRWSALLATGEALFGRLDWWPPVGTPDVRTALWTALACAPRTPADHRPRARPSHFPEPGVVILRDVRPTDDELWCRCDHGPLGLPPLAAHGHADALAIELRAGGIDILADPGTYCYHGEREWRAYFRSTLAHNTLRVGGVDQSISGGPFMWLRPVPTRLVALAGLDDGPCASWEAEHHAYARLSPPAIHRRRVELDRRARTVTVIDRLDCPASHECQLAFHLGDAVGCELRGAAAMLRWTTPLGEMRCAELRLPDELEWSAVRGRTDPPLGWYSPAFDERRPATALIGTGRTGGGRELRSQLQFAS